MFLEASIITIGKALFRYTLDRDFNFIICIDSSVDVKSCGPFYFPLQNIDPDYLNL